MRLLDLFCCAGGSSRGFQNAGFEVVGVDNRPQPRYIGDDFILGDAIQVMRVLLASRRIRGKSGRWYRLEDFYAFAASPPCQGYSEATPLTHKGNHPRLIPDVRALLSATAKPYAIENVAGARAHLINPVMLCGTMFGLPIWRHRYFEMWPDRLLLTPPCAHIQRPITVHLGSNTRKTWLPVLVSGGGDGKRAKRNLHRPRETVDVIRWAMNTPWMTQAELTEAIPPAYTEWLGRRLLEALR